MGVGEYVENGADSADARAPLWVRASRTPFTVLTLSPQHSIEEFGPSSHADCSDHAGIVEAHVALSYVLLRDASDRANPADVAALDGEVSHEADTVPATPHSEWRAHQSGRQRDTVFDDAVRTSWYRESTRRPPVAQILLGHATEVLATSFRRERGLEGKVGSVPPAPDLTPACVQNNAVLRINGTDHGAVKIDTDPHVYAVGAAVGDHILVTVVISRDQLPQVRIELSTRSRDGATFPGPRT